MAIFMLDTDVVTSAANEIGSLTSKINEVANSINSYDTSCEDEFDFSNAKSVLSSNIEACSTKIKNTSVFLENVVSAHTKLQSSMKFDKIYQVEEEITLEVVIQVILQLVLFLEEQLQVVQQSQI